MIEIYLESLLGLILKKQREYVDDEYVDDLLQFENSMGKSICECNIL